MTRLLIYDQEQIGKEIYEKGYIDEFIKDEVVSLAKYIRMKFDCGDAKLKTLLNSFLSKNKNFIEVRMRKVIGKVIKESRSDFKKTGFVVITKGELDQIRKIKNFKWQKIALGLLFVAKRKTNNGYVPLNEWTYVKTASCVSHVKVADIEDVVHYLYIHGKQVRDTEYASHEILFIDLSTDNIVFTIKDDKTARNLGNLYKDWCGGEIYWCKKCEEEFIRKGQTHNYCEKCSKEKELERKRKWKKNKVDALGVV